MSVLARRSDYWKVVVGLLEGGGGVEWPLVEDSYAIYILCLALVGRERKEDITSRVRRYNYYCHEL